MSWIKNIKNESFPLFSECSYQLNVIKGARAQYKDIRQIERSVNDKDMFHCCLAADVVHSFESDQIFTNPGDIRAEFIFFKPQV